MDKFLLASNPMTGNKSGQFVIHMLEPVMVITCNPGHIDAKGQESKHYQFSDAMLTVHEWTLSIYHSESTANLERQVAILDRAWRWFRSYLETQL